VLGRESRPGNGSRPDTETNAFRCQRLDRIHRGGKLDRVPIHQVGNKEPEVDVIGDGSDRPEADERVTRPRRPDDVPAEVIIYPDSSHLGRVRNPRQSRQLPNVGSEGVEDEIDEHEVTVGCPTMANTSHTLGDIPIDVAAYLERISFGGTPRVDLATLTELQQLHMTAVPFENLDVALGSGVTVDAAAAIDKIVEQGRGGWCFEVNAAFGTLLTALGFDVLLLGAAVLLSGPTRVIDHVALEVLLDQPYLTDVGFGESFTRPLGLNVAGPQAGGDGDYEFIPSPQGTTLAKLDDGVPVAQYRFKRVAHALQQFEPASDALQADAAGKWRTKPFATRLLDGGPDRATLTRNRLKVTRGGVQTEQAVPADEWHGVLHDWFGIRLDTPG
jgi:N-hydroxyarylamine O-acetyltransferase